MTGLVLEGGARRCIYTAGILDSFLDNGIQFDYIAGVSAGAQVAMDFVAGQRGRSKAVMLPGCSRGDADSSLLGRLSLSLDKIIYENQYPFDFSQFFAADTICEIVATDCATGRAAYLREDCRESRLLEMLKASCSLPVMYPAVRIDGHDYLDGSIADSIPFQRALDCGCDRVLVILSKPDGEPATDYSKLRPVLAKRYGQQYPELYSCLMDRLARYNQQRERLMEYERKNLVKVICPPENFVKAFETNTEKLQFAYDCGYTFGQAARADIQGFFGYGEKTQKNGGMREWSCC